MLNTTVSDAVRGQSLSHARVLVSADVNQVLSGQARPVLHRKTILALLQAQIPGPEPGPRLRERTFFRRSSSAKPQFGHEVFLDMAVWCSMSRAKRCSRNANSGTTSTWVLGAWWVWLWVRSGSAFGPGLDEVGDVFRHGG